ncbi:MAG: hypothetical protein NTW82_08030 [Bacteroidia bacterium]|nr:hypothetical protein [Bacteroidia bacterium]
MENLIIEPKKQLLGKKGLGVFWILFGIVLVIFGKDSLDKWRWMTSITFCLIGVIHFTPLAGSDKSQIEICEGCLKITWINWIRKITVLDSEIESILLAKNGVIIKRKDKRPLKIEFYFIEKEQKAQVYKFFTEYAQQKNLVQE